MKKSTYVFLFLIVAFLQTSHIYSQSSKRINKAIVTFKAGEYFNAVPLLLEAYERVQKDDEKASIVFMLAECYRRTNQPRKSELWYQKSIKKGYKDPIAIYYLAQALQENEKFDDAIVQFKEYIKVVPDDPRGTIGLKACELSKEWVQNPTGYIVEEAHFFNTKNSDYAPAFARDDYNVLYFTSSREESMGSDIHGGTGQKFTDIFQSTKDKTGAWSVPIPLDENINTVFEEGTPFLANNFKTLYFCRCEKNKNKKQGCYIFTSNQDGETWSKAEALKIGDDTTVIAHPSVSEDGKTIYFASSMKGTLGGADIWKVTKTDNGWGTPENLGDKINTKGDEVYPFIHPDGTLYFASNGQLGMGGLDIFKAEWINNVTWKVQNMGYPVNSTKDDFGITIEKDVERGFFSSSRGSGGDDDIYSLYLPPIKFLLIGKIKDEKTLKVIADADVKLIGSDGFSVQAKTDKEGNFKFMLKPATDYIVLASAEGYLKNKAKETTKGIELSRDFNMSINLSSTASAIELPNIFYDYDKATLRPESMASLDKLIETLNDNPNVTIELMAHTDSRGKDEYNLDLSQRRAQSVVEYLISKGIVSQRLVPKGYGESQPKIIDEKIKSQVPFFELNSLLTESFINGLPSDDYQEIAHQINRRTEFRVLSTDYK